MKQLDLVSLQTLMSKSTVDLPAPLQQQLVAHMSIALAAVFHGTAEERNESNEDQSENHDATSEA
jgi:hypothetical protein